MTIDQPCDAVQKTTINRRQFGVGATALSIGLVGAQAMAQEEAASEPKPKVKLGLIGCGGRGTWIAKLFQAHCSSIHSDATATMYGYRGDGGLRLNGHLPLTG